MLDRYFVFAVEGYTAFMNKLYLLCKICWALPRIVEFLNAKQTIHLFIDQLQQTFLHRDVSALACTYHIVTKLLSNIYLRSG